MPVHPEDGVAVVVDLEVDMAGVADMGVGVVMVGEDIGMADMVEGEVVEIDTEVDVTATAVEEVVEGKNTVINNPNLNLLHKNPN